ncbi:ribonuclease H-like domain-containing protein [Lactarius pseudohatsudake]|nr:ribonuclease H-like domain-containing protein [Lactarius pseudohatsudake]
MDRPRQLQTSTLKATKHATSLSADLAFYRPVDSDLAENRKPAQIKSRPSQTSFLTWRPLLGASKNTIGKGEARVWNEVNFLEHFGSLIVEPMDQLFECADISLDQFSERVAPKGRQEPVIQHAPDLQKPQLKFKRKVDNTNGILWSPTLRHNFNTRVPLGYTTRPPHPYRYEINNLSYLARMFQSQPPIPFKPCDETHLTWSREIAIDLEYHSYRTYSGFVCLVQISLCDEDWIVDPFELRDELEVFTKPSIVKVLHGANSDVVWLQQDFSLYSVIIFDTFHVSRLLDIPRRGLAALLEMYCDFSQISDTPLADWRFLLYVYDNLRNALLDRAVSHGTSPTSRAEVLSRSVETALRMYSPDPYDAEGGIGVNWWDTLARRWNKLTLGADCPTRGPPRGACVAGPCRARGGREYWLSNRFVFKLVEQAPADMPALLHAFLSTPLVVRRRAKELPDAIRAAVKKGLSGTAVPSEPTPAVSSEVTPESRRTLMFPHVSSEPAATSLWSRNKPLPTSTTSSRFGVATVLPRLPSVYSTSQGSLFGFPPTSAGLQTNQVTAVTTAEAVMTSVPDVSIDGATTEIPFVPAALRQTVKPEVIDDAIVVIEQRQKKRKHAKKAGATDDDDAERSTAVPAAEAKAKTEDVVPFDFASAPNMLDEGERSEQELGSGRGCDKRRPY